MIYNINKNAVVWYLYFANTGIDYSTTNITIIDQVGIEYNSSNIAIISLVLIVALLISLSSASYWL